MTHESSVLDPALQAKLRRMNLRIELPDEQTLTVKGVPANRRHFNKARTNLLIKRSSGAVPCVVCVDDDLEYAGTDQALSKAFVAAPTQQGWRILTLGNLAGNSRGDFTAGLECALDILGVEEASDAATAAPETPSKKLLAGWGKNLTEAVSAGSTSPTLFRDEEIEQVVSATLSWEGRLPLILGEPGTGKTNLLRGIAYLLDRRHQEVLAVNMGALLAGTLFESERESLLAALLREAGDSGVVLALEQIEWAVNGTSRSLVLLRDALDRGTRLIATSTPDQERRFCVHPIASKLEIVRLHELCASDTRSVLEQLRSSISSHHAVGIDDELERATVERSISMSGSLPGKAVRLMDAAAARASLTDSGKVTFVDLYVAASRMLGPEGA
jgi:ATP-dependent Clp protease ATP-binding subunit ClpA